MKVIKNLKDMNLSIIDSKCFIFEFLDKKEIADKKYNIDGSKSSDLILTVYDNYKNKFYYTKLMKNKNGQYIDVLNFRYYLKKRENYECCFS